MFKFYQDHRGAFSLFIVLLVLPMFLFVGTVSEAVRILMLRQRLSQARQLAVNAVLADYDASLKENYGLFALSDSEASAYSGDDGTFRKYVEGNFRLETKLYSMEQTGSEKFMYQIQTDLNSALGTNIHLITKYDDKTMRLFDIDTEKLKTEISSAAALGDYNNHALRHQITDLTKYIGPILIAKDIVSDISDLNVAEAEAEVQAMQESEKVNEKLEQVKSDYASIYYAIVGKDTQKGTDSLNNTEIRESVLDVLRSVQIIDDKNVELNKLYEQNKENWAIHNAIELAKNFRDDARELLDKTARSGSAETTELWIEKEEWIDSFDDFIHRYSIEFGSKQSNSHCVAAKSIFQDVLNMVENDSYVQQEDVLEAMQEAIDELEKLKDKKLEQKINNLKSNIALTKDFALESISIIENKIKGLDEQNRMLKSAWNTVSEDLHEVKEPISKLTNSTGTSAEFSASMKKTYEGVESLACEPDAIAPYVDGNIEYVDCLMKGLDFLKEYILDDDNSSGLVPLERYNAEIAAQGKNNSTLQRAASYSGLFREKSVEEWTPPGSYTMFMPQYHNLSSAAEWGNSDVSDPGVRAILEDIYNTYHGNNKEKKEELDRKIEKQEQQNESTKESVMRNTSSNSSSSSDDPISKLKKELEEQKEIWERSIEDSPYESRPSKANSEEKAAEEDAGDEEADALNFLKKLGTFANTEYARLLEWVYATGMFSCLITGREKEGEKTEQTLLGNSFSSPNERPLMNSEIEYILHGKQTAQENLAQTAAELYAVRYALDLISIMRCKELMAIIDSIAAVAGVGVGYALVKVALIAALAAAEASYDVVMLQTGNKVLFYKKKITDFGAIQTVMEMIGEDTPTASDSSDNDSEKPRIKWDYMDYMKGFLGIKIAVTDEMTMWRMMDLIGYNLNNKKIKSKITALKNSAAIEHSFLFFDFTFFSDNSQKPIDAVLYAESCLDGY